LEQKYALNNINTILYTLAVDINCLNAHSSNLDNKLARCLFANCNISICYRLDNFLTTKGIATAALALLELEANASSCVAAKRQQLLRRL
ncbi:uncharacterized protein BDR25DRAFT_366265, partial [Lindgomyces ingoldianus]